MHVAEARLAYGQGEAHQLRELFVQAWFRRGVWHAFAARWSLLQVTRLGLTGRRSYSPLVSCPLSRPLIRAVVGHAIDYLSVDAAAVKRR